MTRLLSSLLLATATSEDLTGWRILPENPNVQDTNLVRAFLDVFVGNDPGHTAEAGEMLAASFVMDGLVFDRVEGDFGNDEIYPEVFKTTFRLLCSMRVSANKSAKLGL